MESNADFIIQDDKIIFSDDFNSQLDNYIQLISTQPILYFGNNFNQELVCLTPNIKTIILGKKFNKSLEHLPETLESIIFVPESEYYYPLNFLNNNIKELILGDSYDTKIKKFPFHLEKLRLSSDYIYEIDEFPPNLKYLDIGSSYNYPLINLPPCLETLIIDGKFNQLINYPFELKHLVFKPKSEFAHELLNLPPKLIYLEITHNYFLPIHKLSENIKCLSLGDYYSGQISSLPKNLIKLKFSRGFKYFFSEIPEGVRVIELYSNYIYIDELINKYHEIELNILK